jgi:hypothetical protein
MPFITLSSISANGKEIQVDFEVLDPEILGDDAKLRHGHEAARDRADEHAEHHPEHRCAQSFAERVVAPALGDLIRRLHLVALGRAQRERGDQDDAALDEAEPEESCLVAAARDRVGNREDRESRACAKAACGETHCKPPTVREPLDGAVDAGGIDAADADAACCSTDIEAGQRRRVGIDDPGQACEQAADENHDPRTMAVDEVALDGREPGLYDHEDREGGLDRGAAPAVGLLNFRHEEGPGVLHVGRCDHADHAYGELDPAIVERK